MSTINIKPLADRVLIEPAAAETKTSSGLYIPDTAKEKPQKGIVVAVGPGTKENAVTLSVGDTVLYGKYAGTELQHDGKDFLIMKENDILAIV
jgi:chaperonin GroES